MPSVQIIKENSLGLNRGLYGSKFGNALNTTQVNTLIAEGSAVNVGTDASGLHVTSTTDDSGKINYLLNQDGSKSGIASQSLNYFHHSFYGNQTSQDGKLYDISGVGNDGVRGANLSVAQMNATAGFASTVTPNTGVTDSVIRMPALNLDYNAGESLILWWLGQGAAPAAQNPFLGDSLGGATTGIRVRGGTTGKADLTIYGAGATTFFGKTSSGTIFDGTLHSFGLVINGQDKTYGYFVDEVLDAGFSGGTYEAITGTQDTRTSNTFNIGSSAPASTASLNGMAVSTRALVMIKLPSGKACPSVAVVQSLFKALRRNPDGLVSAGDF